MGRVLTPSVSILSVYPIVESNNIDKAMQTTLHGFVYNNVTLLVYTKNR